MTWSKRRQEFYRLFWHYELSAEEAEQLLARSTRKTRREGQ